MKVVIIGGGISGSACIEHISRDKEGINVSLIEKEPFPFRKCLLSDWLAGKVSDTDFFVSFEELRKIFPGIEIINDKAVRVNFEKKKVFLKKGTPLSFDKLVLACGLKPKKLGIAGEYKEGVYYLGRVKPSGLKESIRMFNHIVVYGETLMSVDLSLKIRSICNKEIKAIIPEFNSFPSEYKDKIASIFRGKGIDFLPGENISEALGESRVRAVKMSSGKFLACDLLFLDTVLSPDTDIVKDTPALIRNSAIKVDETLRLGYDFCFSCGDMINSDVYFQKGFAGNRDLAFRQGAAAGSNLFEGREIFNFSREGYSPEDLVNRILR